MQQFISRIWFIHACGHAENNGLILSSEIKLMSMRMLNCPALLSHPHNNHYEEEKLLPDLLLFKPWCYSAILDCM
jgi:hypothetical protein